MKCSARGSFFFIAFISSAVVFALFQNCAEQRFSSVAGSSAAPSMNTGGGSSGGFDGMVYAAVGSCAGGNQDRSAAGYQSILVLAGDFSGVTFLRRNCVDFSPGERPSYTASRFAFASPDRTVIVLEGVRFTLVNSAQAPSALTLAWSCPLVGGGSAAVYRDPQFPALYYNQYSGRDRSGAQVSTDVVNSARRVSSAIENYTTASFEASLIAPLPFIDISAPTSASVAGGARMQNDDRGEIAVSCVANAPTPTPAPTPAPTPIATPNLNWIYFGHVSRTVIALSRMPYCASEAISLTHCGQFRGTCWIFSGTYSQGGENFYNFFSCQ